RDVQHRLLRAADFGATPPPPRGSADALSRSSCGARRTDRGRDRRWVRCATAACSGAWTTRVSELIRPGPPFDVLAPVSTGLFMGPYSATSPSLRYAGAQN